MEPRRRRTDSSAQENSLEKYRKNTKIPNITSSRQTIRPHRCSGYHVEVTKTQIEPSSNKNEISLPLSYLSPQISKHLQDSSELKDRLSPPPSLSEVSQVITTPNPKRDNFKINKFLLFKHRHRSITSSSQIVKESAATTIATIPPPSVHLNSTISNMKSDQEKPDFFLVSSNFPSLSNRQESREIQPPQYQSIQSPQNELHSEQNIQIKSKTDIMSTSIQLTHQTNQPTSKIGLKNLISPVIQSHNKLIIPSNTDLNSNNLKSNCPTSNSSNDINIKGNFESSKHQINRYLVPSSQKHLPLKESPRQLVPNPLHIAQPLSHRKLNCPPKLFTTFHGGNSISDLSVDRILHTNTSNTQQDTKQPSSSKQCIFKTNCSPNSSSNLQNQVTSLKLLPLDNKDEHQAKNLQRNAPASFFHISRDTNTIIPRKGLQMSTAMSQTEQCIPIPLSPTPSPLKTNRSMINIFRQQPLHVVRSDQNQQLMTQSVQLEQQPTQLNKLKTKLATITARKVGQTQETNEPLQQQQQQQQQQQPENTEKPPQKPFDKLYTSFLAVQFKNQLMGKNKRSNQMFNRLSIESRIELSRLVQYLIYMQNQYENIKKVSQLIHQIVYHIPYLVNMLFKEDKTIILRDVLDLDYIMGYLANKDKMDRFLPDKNNNILKDINAANKQYEALIEDKILSDIAYLNEKLSLLVQKRFEDKFDHVSNAIIKEHYEIKLLEKHLQKRIADQSQTQPLPMNGQLKARYKYQGIDHYTFESKNPRFYTFSQRFGKQAQRLGAFTGIDQQTLTISSNLDQVYKKIQAESETKLELNQSQQEKKEQLQGK